MLENLLFSLNMSLPLFVVMGLGCVLTHKGFFTEDYVSHTTNLVYYILLPGKMFLDIATSDLGAAARWAISQGIRPVSPDALVEAWRAVLGEVLGDAS